MLLDSGGLSTSVVLRVNLSFLSGQEVDSLSANSREASRTAVVTAQLFIFANHTNGIVYGSAFHVMH